MYLADLSIASFAHEFKYRNRVAMECPPSYSGNPLLITPSNSSGFTDSQSNSTFTGKEVRFELKQRRFV